MHIFLTGASSGIGAATVRLAVARGWKVSGCARRADRLAALAEELGAPFLPLTADVQDEASLAAAAQQAHAHFGQIDGVIANAGRGVDGELLQLSAEDVAQVYDVNVVGVHRTVLATKAYWSQRPVITAVSSVAAFLPIPRMGAYCATKHALEAWAAALRMEGKEHGLRVCTCCPGTVSTEFFAEAPKPGQVWDWRPGSALHPDSVAKVLLRQVANGTPRRKCLPWFANLAALLYRCSPRLVESIMAGKLKGMRRS